VRGVSVATCFAYAIPIERQIPLVASTGFTHLSLGGRLEHSGLLDPRRRDELAGRLGDHALRVDTVHAARLDREDAVATIAATIEAAAAMRAPVVVAHAGPFACERGDVEDIVRRVAAHARTLAPVAREHGVRVALENVMPGPATEIATRALADLDPEVFGFCYDSSHDQIDGPRSFALRLRDRLDAPPV
jgi:sugar phosphate isomerase/epimerase